MLWVPDSPWSNGPSGLRQYQCFESNGVLKLAHIYDLSAISRPTEGHCTLLEIRLR